jgi:hypothetical protein
MSGKQNAQLAIDDSQDCLDWKHTIEDMNSVINTLRGVADGTLHYEIEDLCRDVVVYLTCLQVDLQENASLLITEK